MFSKSSISLSIAKAWVLSSFHWTWVLQCRWTGKEKGDWSQSHCSLLFLGLTLMKYWCPFLESFQRMVLRRTLHWRSCGISPLNNSLFVEGPVLTQLLPRVYSSPALWHICSCWAPPAFRWNTSKIVHAFVVSTWLLKGNMHSFPYHITGHVQLPHHPFFLSTTSLKFSPLLRQV